MSRWPPRCSVWPAAVARMTSRRRRRARRRPPTRNRSACTRTRRADSSASAQPSRARHDYPSPSTVTVARTGCGVSERWEPRPERSAEWRFCLDAGRWRLDALLDYHEFFGQAVRQEFLLRRPLRPARTHAADRVPLDGSLPRRRLPRDRPLRGNAGAVDLRRRRARGGGPCARPRGASRPNRRRSTGSIRGSRAGMACWCAGR